MWVHWRKVIFLSFPFEEITSETDRNTFMERSVTWLYTITLHSPYWFIGSSYNSCVLLKNTSSTSINVTPTIYYQGGSYTVTSAPAGAGWNDFPTIPAHQARFFTVSGYRSYLNGAKYGGMELSHTGAPGSLVATTTTLSGKTGLSFDVPFETK